MRDDVNYVYRIWDVDNNQYWHSPRGEHQWSSRVAAKHAWQCACGWRRCPTTGRRLTFDEQRTDEQYVIHKFRLQRVK
jgi:hypothetical protein